MNVNFAKHVLVLIFNFLIVATIGLLLRLMPVETLPELNFVNIKHAHSHFAFAGWISQALMFLIYYYLSKSKKISRLDWGVYWANMLFSFGMLFTFSWQGYAPFSIGFSTLSVFGTYAFCLVVFRKIRKTKMPEIPYLKASLFFLIFSSIGTFILAALMASKSPDLVARQASIYFYLHFQYNGWFLFAFITLIISFFKINITNNRRVFTGFLAAGFLTFSLSLPTLYNHEFTFILGGLGAFLQLIFIIPILVGFNTQITLLSSTKKRLAQYILIAFLLKCLLQLGSAFPGLKDLAFHNLNVVLSYLHFVFLGIFSLGIILLFWKTDLLSNDKKNNHTITALTIAIIVNLILMLSLGFVLKSDLNAAIRDSLVGIGLLICLILFLLFLQQFKHIVKLNRSV